MFKGEVRVGHTKASMAGDGGKGKIIEGLGGQGKVFGGLSEFDGSILQGLEQMGDKNPTYKLKGSQVAMWRIDSRDQREEMGRAVRTWQQPR